MDCYETRELLTREEERDLLEEYKQIQKEHGAFEDSQPVQCEARDRLFEHNIGLVIDIAKSFVPDDGSIDIEDLAQIGCLGLARAIDKFDLDRGTKLSTYATYWIRQRIRRGMHRLGDLMNRTRYVHRKIQELNSAEDALREELGRKPTEEELREELGWGAKKFQDTLRAKDAKVFSGLSFLSKKPGDGQADYDRARWMVDQDSVREFQSSWRERIVQWVFDAAELNDTEQEILIRRFGLGESTPHTLKEIALEFPFNRERVRQIEIKALEKIRSTISKEELEFFGHLTA